MSFVRVSRCSCYKTTNTNDLRSRFETQLAVLKYEPFGNIPSITIIIEEIGETALHVTQAADDGIFRCFAFVALFISNDNAQANFIVTAAAIPGACNLSAVFLLIRRRIDRAIIDNQVFYCGRDYFVTQAASPSAS